MQGTIEVLWAPVGVLGSRIQVQGPYGAMYALLRLYWGLGTVLGYRGPMGPYWGLWEPAVQYWGPWLFCWGP